MPLFESCGSYLGQKGCEKAKKNGLGGPNVANGLFVVPSYPKQIFAKKKIVSMALILVFIGPFAIFLTFVDHGHFDLSAFAVPCIACKNCYYCGSIL